MAETPKQSPLETAAEALRRRVKRLADAPLRPEADTIADDDGESAFRSLFAAVRAEVAARRVAVTEHPPLELPPIHVTEVAVPVAPGPAALPDASGEQTLETLLAFEGEDFVTAAYLAVLGRAPDPDGFAHFVRALYEGASKLSVVEALAGSGEGRAKNARIRGLAHARRLDRWQRIPVVGRLIALFRARQLPAHVRRHEVLHRRHLHDLRQQARHHNELVQAVTRLAESVERLEREKAPRTLALAVNGRVAALHARYEEILAQLEARSRRTEVAGLGEAVVAAIAELRAQLRDAESARRALAAAVGLADSHGESAAAEDLDQLYVAFEDRFRGTRDDIRGRLEVYLPHVREALAGGDPGVVLDVGCGRGEWLELLRDSGVTARGVDLNAAMVEVCRKELGLDVVQADAVAYLERQAPSSLGAVTAFHVIEHLSFRQRIAFLRACHRALRPGGLIILETPNPETLSVGACTFWVDPTHMQPLPPAATQAIVELLGFGEARIERLHPFPHTAHLPEGGQLRDSLNHLLFGPQDYAIVARKPGEATG